MQKLFPPALTVLCLTLLLLPTKATENQKVVQAGTTVNAKKLCNFNCKECQDSNSDVCTSCPQGLYLNSGACHECDSHCLNSFFCSQTGCLKCKEGYFSAASEAHGGTFHCFKQKPLARVSWTLLVLVPLTLLLALILIKSLSKLRDTEEDNYLYIAETNEEIPSNVIIKGKSDLNNYFNDKVWMDI